MKAQTVRAPRAIQMSAVDKKLYKLGKQVDKMPRHFVLWRLYKRDEAFYLYTVVACLVTYLIVR